MGEKSKKEKKSKKEVEEPVADGAPKKLYLAPIAKPLADDKLSKKARTLLMMLSPQIAYLDLD